MTARRAAITADPSFYRGEHGVGHLPEGAQRLMAVLPLAEMTLGQGLEAVPAERVDQHRDLDSVTDRERNRFEQRPATGELSGQGLGETGQPRLVKVDQRVAPSTR